jgi:hypothetical protein
MQLDQSLDEREARQILTEVRRLCGHVETEPSAVSLTGKASLTRRTRLGRTAEQALFSHGSLSENVVQGSKRFLRDGRRPQISRADDAEVVAAFPPESCVNVVA